MPTEAASAASAELLGLGLTTAAIAVYAYESYSSARKRAASEDEDTEPNKNTAHDNVRSSRKASKKRPKMVAEAGSNLDPRVIAGRKRLLACGYPVEGAEIQIIHCNDQPGCEDLPWLRNGFVQCFTEIDGRRARVMDYAPGQELQPHRHDIDELFAIRGGSVVVSKWENHFSHSSSSSSLSSSSSSSSPPRPSKAKKASKANKSKNKQQVETEHKELFGTRSSHRLKAGDLLEIPSNMPHGLVCDPKMGLQFHELVGVGEQAFAKRSTEFLVRYGLKLAYA